MVYVKWIFWGSFWVLLAAFLHYTLPQYDVVRVTDTYEERVNFGENALFWSNQGTGEVEGAINRDIFFIQTKKANDRVMVYRNEDTGWGWPPFFKFDTANLQAEATDLKSSPEAPKWVAIRHYGWRNEFMSIYPNALSVKQVPGPEARVFSWISIVILVLLAALLWGIYARWRRFRDNKLNPTIDEWTDGWG